MRILLAEDDHALSQVLAKILEKNNYTVDAVFNGADALEYLRNGNYTAVILDLIMPIMDGFDVLKTVRSENINVPIIALSVISEVKEKVRVLDLGANDFLTKPFDTEELLARLCTITRGRSSFDSTLSFGNTVLNRATFELSSPTKCIRLTNKEFQIFELLRTETEI